MPRTERGTFAEGNPGRPPGANKLTVKFRAALELVYEQRGGAAGLLEWSKANPDEFYRILARLIPQEVKVELGLDEELTKLLAESIRRRIEREL